MATSMQSRYDEHRNKVLLGDLPEDFLRVAPSTRQQQEAADEQAALMLQQQQFSPGFHPQNTVGKLQITIVQADLVKNYGVTRMDPYCRVRIGHTVYETHTDHNGARTPHWNKVIQCYLPQGVTTFYLEIYDECTFTMDEKIAWGQFNIPEAAFKGETVEDWYPISGKQGEEKEGRVNLVVSFTPIRSNQVMYATSSPVVVVPPQAPIPYGLSPQATIPYGVPFFVPSMPPQVQQPPAPPTQPMITEDDVKQIKEMFPNVDTDVVNTILESNRGNKDASINALLQISSGN